MEWKISDPERPELLLKRLLIIIISLVVLSTLLQSLKYIFHVSFTALNFSIFLFNVDQERNIPTFFSVLLLLYLTKTLYSISIEKIIGKDSYMMHWCILTFLFLLISADEFMATHEMISEIIREKYLVSGFFYYAWIIPFSILVLFLSLFYAGFVFTELPSDIRNLAMLAALLYIGGSLGMEMLAGHFVQKVGTDNMTNAILSGIEEGMEMTGIAVFIYALMKYKNRSVPAMVTRSEDQSEYLA